VIRLRAQNANGDVVSCSNDAVAPSEWGAWIAVDDEVTEVEVAYATTQGGSFTVLDTIALSHTCNTVFITDGPGTTNAYEFVTCSTGTIYLDNQSTSNTYYVYVNDETTPALTLTPNASPLPSLAADEYGTGQVTITQLKISASRAGPGSDAITLTVAHSHQDTIIIRDYDDGSPHNALGLPMAVTPTRTAVKVKNETGHDCCNGQPASECVSAGIAGQSPVNICDGQTQTFDLSTAQKQWVIKWADDEDPKIVIKKTDCTD
jgi:hypothetical protein